MLTRRIRRTPWAMAMVLVLWRPAFGQTTASDERAEFQFALVQYDGSWNPRPSGLERLAWEIRRRTSIAVNLEVATVDPAQDELFSHPMLVWQGEQRFDPLSPKAVGNLRHHLSVGGTLLVDASDGDPQGAFLASVRRDLARVFPDRPLKRISPEHVLYKAFYLLDRHGGRVNSRSFLEGAFVGERLAVIVSTNDLAGAIARDAYGEWQYDVGVGGDTTREMTFRLGINVAMYVLCLDYKDDQVHLPFILQRRH